MIYWEEDFCKCLADKGYYVIRFDNRDSGLSTIFKEKGIPNVKDAIFDCQKEMKVNPPYRLDEMADDAVGLLDALRIDTAHICGMSMGGMIAFIIGYRHPLRALTLTSIMSGFAHPSRPVLDSKSVDYFLTSVPEDYASYIRKDIALWKTINGNGYLVDENQLKKLAGQAFENGIYPGGTARQLVALISHQFLKSDLGSISAQTLLIHGAKDPVSPIVNSKGLLSIIPNTQLLVFDKMGHRLPKELWPEIIDAISSQATEK